MKTRLIALLTLSTVALLVGCGGDDTTTPTGDASVVPDSSPTQDAAVQDGASPQQDSSSEGDTSTGSDVSTTDSEPGPDGGALCGTTPDKVNFIFSDIDHCVELKDLKLVDVSGSDKGYELKELWSRLGIKADPSKAVFDSKGADGVLASSHKKCAAGMPGTEFLEGYILKDTKNLVWPKGSPEACFLTKNTTTIIGKLKN